jgi:hypothetical protein
VPKDCQNGQADNANSNQSRHGRFWDWGKRQAHWSKSCAVQKRQGKRAGSTREQLESHIPVVEPELFFLRNRVSLETPKPQAWQRASPRALSIAGLCQLRLLVVLARP